MGESSGEDTIRTAETVFRAAVTIGRITLWTTRASMRTIMVLAAVYNAGIKPIDNFVKAHGTSLGYMDINSENAEALNAIEGRLKKAGVEYVQLPELQNGDGRTQYLYDLNNLPQLHAFLHEYNSSKIKKLGEMKSSTGSDLAEYQMQKENLEKQMPEIRLISAEEYAKTSLIDGHDTQEYLDLEKQADKMSKQYANKPQLSASVEVKSVFDSINADQEAKDIHYMNNALTESKEREIPSKRRSR